MVYYTQNWLTLSILDFVSTRRLTESKGLGILLFHGLIRVSNPTFARRNKNTSKYLLLFNLAEIDYGLFECGKSDNSFQNSF
jgi:hypothetical protein